MKLEASLINCSASIKIPVSRDAAALYLRQWREARMRIRSSQRESGARAYHCYWSDQTVVVEAQS